MNLKLFKNINFSLFVFGQSTSTLGTTFLNIALALYVLEFTGSAGKFASILAIAAIPKILLGPIVGTIVERVDRKKVIVSMDLLRGVFALLVFILSLLTTLDMWLIYLVVFFYSICQTFFSPAFMKILPGILSKEDIVDGNSLQRTIDETVLVVAPMIGALFYGLYGISLILLIDGLTYIISGISEVFMRIPPQMPRDINSSFGKDVIDGFKILFVDKRITSLISNGTLTHIFLFPFVMVGFPYIIKAVLSGKAVDYGFVESIAAIGSLLAIFFVSFAKKKYNIAQCIGIGILGMLVFVIAMLPLSSNLFLSLLHGNSTYLRLFFGSMNFIMFLSFSFYGIFYVSFWQVNMQMHMHVNCKLKSLERFISES